MSEGQRWLWHMHHMATRMHLDSREWLLEAGLPLPQSLQREPFHLMQYWQQTGQYLHAKPHVPNAVAPPYVHREQINKCPPPLPTFLAE